MEKIESRADTRSEEFRVRRQAMETLVGTLREETARARRGGAGRERHAEQKKMFVRDRIDALLDPGSPFLELSPLAAHGMYDGEAPGAGLVTGVGRVAGREVMVIANDATVKGGTYFPMTVRSCRCRPRCSPTATTSGGSSSTRRGCRPSASRRSRS